MFGPLQVHPDFAANTCYRSLAFCPARTGALAPLHSFSREKSLWRGPASSPPLPIPSPLKQMMVKGRLGDRASWPYSPDLCFWVFSEVRGQATEAPVGGLEGGGEHQPRGSSHKLPALPTPLIRSTAAPPSLNPPAASPAPGPSVDAQLCNLGQASEDVHHSRLGGHELPWVSVNPCEPSLWPWVPTHSPSAPLHVCVSFPNTPCSGPSSSSISQEDIMFAETTEPAPTLPEVRPRGQSRCSRSVCLHLPPAGSAPLTVHGLYR